MTEDHRQAIREAVEGHDVAGLQSALQGAGVECFEYRRSIFDEQMRGCADGIEFEHEEWGVEMWFGPTRWVLWEWETTVDYYGYARTYEAISTDELTRSLVALASDEEYEAEELRDNFERIVEQTPEEIEKLDADLDDTFDKYRHLIDDEED